MSSITTTTGLDKGAAAALAQKFENLKYRTKVGALDKKQFTDTVRGIQTFKDGLRKQRIGWSPDEERNRENGIDFDISLERPLEGMRKQLESLMTVRGKRPTTMEHLNTVATYHNENELVTAFVHIIKGDDGGHLQGLFGEKIDSYNELITKYQVRKDRFQEPQPGPPIISERDMTRSAVGSGGVWFRQVRRLPSETLQVELVIRLGHAIRAGAGDIVVRNSSDLALPESNANVLKMESVATNLFRGLFKKTYASDFRSKIQDAISENQKIRAVGVLLASVNICELAACSTSYRALRLANRMAISGESTADLNANKSASHLKSAASTFSPGAVDLSYDMINKAFQAHLVRIFTQIISWVNDTLQEKIDTAMFELIRMGTTTKTSQDVDEEIAARHLCTVVVTYFRMLIVVNLGGSGSPAGKLFEHIAKLLISPLQIGMVGSLGLQALRMRFQLPSLGLGLRQGVTAKNRNDAMRALYAAHGLAIRFHPIDAQGIVMGRIAIARGAIPNPSSASSFFSVHAPLCVMLVDYAFVENHNIFLYKHMKKNEESKIIEECTNPRSVNGILDLVDKDDALMNRCIRKLALSPENMKQLGVDGGDADSSLRRAGRIIYNAIMSTDQFREKIDEDVRRYYMRSQATFSNAFNKSRPSKNTYRSSARGGNLTGNENERINKLNTRLLNLTI